MICGRTANNKINRLHERALRIAYEDFESTFEELLTKDGSVTIHQRNLRALAIEMYKVSNKLSPPFMSDLFIEKNVPYNTRSNVHIDTKDDKTHCTKKSNFRTPKPKTTHYGLETIRWMGPSIWNLVPEDIKKAKTLDLFKKEVKKLTFDSCPCKLCKEYIQGIGFLN